MSRTVLCPQPDREQVLKPVHQRCPACGGRLRFRFDNRHTVATLDGLISLHLLIRRREHPDCADAPS